MSDFDVLHYDCETRSKLELSDVGAARYVRHKSTEVLSIHWAFNDEDVVNWQPLRGEPMPERLRKGLADPDVAKCGWNILGFDNGLMREKYGINIPVESCIDGMIIAMMHNLPAGLDACARAVRSPELKDQAGKGHIGRFSKPLPANAVLRRQGYDFRDWTTDPEEWDGFMGYGDQDVVTCRDTVNRIPRWNCTDFELRVLQVNCAINERGIPLDADMCRSVVQLAGHKKAELIQRAIEITGGIRPTQREKYKQWLLTQGIVISNTQKGTMEEILRRKSTPDHVRTVVLAGLELGKTSTSKYQTALDCLCPDGTVKWSIQYAGAHTLRFAGRDLQPHNFPRGTVEAQRVKLFTKGHTVTGRVPRGDFFADASSSLRNIFKAPEGWDFSQSDLSAIEGRGTAWIAGEQWVLDEYAKGADMYVMDFAMCFGMDYEELFERFKAGDKDAKDMRQKGKPINLAFGYAGGVNAFVNMAKNYGIDLVEMARGLWKGGLLREDDIAAAKRLFHMPKFKHNIVASGFADDMDTWVALDCVKRAWRRAHWRTAAFWRELDYAIRQAVDNPCTYDRKTGELKKRCVYTCGVNDCLEVEVVSHLGDDWLRIRLPSGRYLSYLWPKISGRKKQPVFTGEVNEDGSLVLEDEDEDDTVISYYAPNSGGIMVKKYMHAGVFTENIVQAFCRDVLCEGLIRCEEDPELTPVLHVHDEVVCLTKGNKVDRITSHLCQPVAWAPGLQLAGEGWFFNRYQKD
jgi:DNA polymerase